MAITQLALMAAQMGLSFLGQQQAEESYTENVEAVINAGKVNAERALIEGRLETYQYRYKADQLRGSAMAATAARGGSLSGSTLDVMAAQEQVHRFNTDLIRYNAGINSRNSLINTRNQIIGLNTSIENKRITTSADMIAIANKAYTNINGPRVARAVSNITVANDIEEKAFTNELIRKQTADTYGGI